MRAYQLYLRGERAWDWVGTIDAPTHADAFRKALRCLGPGDADRPIRIEEDTEGAYRKPCQSPLRSPAAATIAVPERSRVEGPPDGPSARRSVRRADARARWLPAAASQRP